MPIVVSGLAALSFVPVSVNDVCLGLVVGRYVSESSGLLWTAVGTAEKVRSWAPGWIVATGERMAAAACAAVGAPGATALRTISNPFGSAAAMLKSVSRKLRAESIGFSAGGV